MLRGLVLHIVALAVAGALALYVWTREETPLNETAAAMVEVWPGNPDKLSLITFQNDKRKLRLEAREDELGRWFVATVERDVPKAPTKGAHSDPHGHEGHDHDTQGNEKNKQANKPEMTRETTRFVGVGEANVLAKAFAPFMAARRIGKVEKSREEEFGLKEPEGTATFTIGDSLHKLVLGGTAPGGTDRYVRVAETTDVYAIDGDLANRLLFAESRLLERELHSWDPKSVTRVRIENAGKSRELVPVEGKLDGWAGPDSPGALDETAGNWMSKLARVRVNEYVEKPAAAPRPEDRVVRVEYFEKKKPLGYLEIYRQKSKKAAPAANQSADANQKPDKNEVEYIAKTEHTRWYFTVLKSSAEQVDQDLGSVLK